MLNTKSYIDEKKGKIEMRIGLMTDSHDHLTLLHRAVEWCNNNKIEHVLHSGDLVAPFVHRALKNLSMPYTMVFGNNDGERTGLSKIFTNKIFTPPYELELDGKKIVLLHEPDPLNNGLDAKNYDLILYGHTHSIDIRKEPTLIINPGELCGWLTGQTTMAVWDTESNKVDIITL